MKRTNIIFLLFAVLSMDGFPAVALGDFGSSVAGIVSVDILFDTTAPYYEPHVATVSPDVPVRWRNPTASPHSVRHDGCATDGLCAFQSGAVPPNASFMIAPLSPGRYAYHCELHPIMRGMLVVLDPQAASAYPAGAVPK